MTIEVLRTDQLSEDDAAAWSHLQQSNDVLMNPFFSLEFARAVAEVRGRVDVAIQRQQGQPVGFLPFELVRRGIGKPVATRVSEVQGIIGDGNVEWDPAEFLRSAGLSSWTFDSLPVCQRSFQAFAFCQDDSPYIDLSEGFDAYQSARRSAGSNQIAQAFRKARKIEREIGPLRFELHTADQDAIAALFSWKKEQYARTGAFDVFCLDWVKALLQHLCEVQNADFGGILSALYVQDQVIAVHMGIRSANVLAWWFPAFDRRYDNYSPGLILLTKVLQSVGSVGIERIDLGRGSERYKTSFQTGACVVAEGVVDGRVVHWTLRRGAALAREWAETSTLGRPALHVVRRARQWIAHRNFLPADSYINRNAAPSISPPKTGLD